MTTADLLVHGGRILSFHPGAAPATALAIRDGRVLAVGGDELLGQVDAHARLHLEGRVVIPGLIDAHAHVTGLGRWREELDLRAARSFDDVVALVRAAAAGRPAGEMIRGSGWNQERWPGGAMPLHAALSAASPEHPVLLRRIDGHATLANARAMVGLPRDAASPEGGEILRDAAGAPTGVFIDKACDLLPAPPAPTPAQRERWALAAHDACLRAGLTGVHDAGADEESLATFERLMDEGRWTLRLNVMLEGQFEDGDHNAGLAARPKPWLASRLAAGPVSHAKDGRLSLRAVKIYADGALGSRGAALLAPYSDRPDARGLLQMSEATLTARVRSCRQAGFQAAVHAIGDAANRAALDAFEDALGEDAASDHRFRVEHAQILAAGDLPRFAALGVIASVQPTHATSDMRMAGERLGEERLRGAYAWRSLLRSGARLALGSDFPIEHENPFWGVFAASERVDHLLEPVGGWRPEEKLSREEALRGFTQGAAFAGFDERELGSLEPGKRADFVVVASDPLTCDPDVLRDLQPDETWVGGRLAATREGIK